MNKLLANIMKRMKYKSTKKSTKSAKKRGKVQKVQKKEEQYKIGTVCNGKDWNVQND